MRNIPCKLIGLVTINVQVEDAQHFYKLKELHNRIHNITHSDRRERESLNKYVMKAILLELSYEVVNNHNIKYRIIKKKLPTFYIYTNNNKEVYGLKNINTVL